MNSSSYMSYSVKDIFSLIKEWKSLIFRNWLSIATIGVFGGVIGICYAYFKKPNYTAELSFATEVESASKISSYMGLINQLGFDIGGSAGGVFEGDNLVEFLKSKTLIEKTLFTKARFANKDEILIKRFLDENKMTEKVSKKVPISAFDTYPEDENRFRDSVIDKISSDILKTKLSVQRQDRKLNIINVKYKSTDEMFAKAFVENLTANAVSFFVTYKTEKLQQNVKILQKQVDSVRGLLYGNIESIASTNDLNVNPLKQTLRVPTQKLQINSQVNSALYAELVKNLELSKLTLRKEMPFIQIIDKPRLPLLKEKPGRLLSAIIFSIMFSFLFVTYITVKKYIK